MPDATWKAIRDLAPKAAVLLAAGSLGSSNLAEISALLLVRASELGPSGSALARLGRDVLQAAWEDDPLNGTLATQLIRFQDQVPWLPPRAEAAARQVADNWENPGDMRYFSRLASRQEYGKAGDYILSRMKKEPGNLFWLKRLLVHCAVTQDWDMAREPLKAKNGPLGGPLEFSRESVLATADLQAGDRGKAAERLERAARLMPLPGLDERAASLTLSHGDGDEAMNRLLRVLSVRPWHTSLALRLHDRINDLDKAACPPPGRTRILLYSFNKCDLFKATLDSLLASDLGGARITALDNGSSDGTADMLGAMADGPGAGIMDTVLLPANVGAAAARNWLKDMAAKNNDEFCVYLDDDVELPRDWLNRLGAAAKALPHAGVWGCRVNDFESPLIIQHADLHLLEPDEELRPALDKTRGAAFSLSEAHNQVLDLGQFDYMRPCASVTGCCHMFRTDRLIKAGDFSLALSPSQFDDLEHDLRLGTRGMDAAYQGHLKILHKKSAGKAAHQTPAQHGNALGNKYKIQGLVPEQDVLALMARSREVLFADLEAKLAETAQALPGPNAG